MEKGLLEKTGKPLDHWIKVVKNAKLDKHKAILAFLKKEHGFTHGYANFVALKARSADAGSSNPEDLVEAQYSKGKEHLRPVYEQLIAVIQGFGGDVELAPKKSSVSLRVKRQFALIKPSTKTRIDLGLKFNNKPIGTRLQGSGPFGSMCTHRVILTNISEIDDELIGWLKEAYDQAR